jgi:hypothetical protein
MVVLPTPTPTGPHGHHPQALQPVSFHGKRAERIKASCDARKAALASGKVVRLNRLPCWLYWDEQNDRPSLNAAKAEIVRQLQNSSVSRAWQIPTSDLFAPSMEQKENEARINEGDGRHELVKLWALCSPGDDARPVLTIMLEGED